MSEQEVESLHRVLTRLALTQDGKLEDILAKLLPLVLGKLDGATPSIQKAVLDILSHVNTRLQAMPAVHLPLTDLLNLYSTSTSPLVRNFALVYVERAAERAPADARFRHLNALLQGVASRPAPHQGTLLRLTARALEHLAVQGNAFALGAPKTFSAAYPFLNSDADRTVFLNFALRLVLYTPATVRGPTSALAAGRAATAGSAASDAGGDQPMAPARPPPGLSFADVAQIEGKAAPSPAALQTQKLGVLNFTALAGVRPEECLQLYLAAACDPGEQVQRRGDELVKKRCAVDGAHPIVDLEQPSAIIPLFDLFLGSLEDDSVPEDQRQAPAGPSMKGRLLGLFCRSVAAANVAPQAMTVVTECLFGTGTSPRLQQQGMEFSVWMMKHAEPAVLAPAAPALLGGCLSLLSSSATQDAQNLAVRSFAYQALGQLAQRHAAALQGRVDIATLCFHGLAAEPPGVRAAVQEATSCLAGAFMQRDASTESELLDMLHASMNHPQEAVRGAAVQWAVRLFPFDHVQARYLCILGSADSRMQLADAATEGLLPERFAAKVTADKARDVQYPALHSMLQYLCRRHPSLKTHMEESQRLALPPKAYVAAIAFSEGCRRQQERQGRAMSDEDVAAYLGEGV